MDTTIGVTFLVNLKSCSGILNKLLLDFKPDYRRDRIRLAGFMYRVGLGQQKSNLLSTPKLYPVSGAGTMHGVHVVIIYYAAFDVLLNSRAQLVMWPFGRLDVRRKYTWLPWKLEEDPLQLGFLGLFEYGYKQLCLIADAESKKGDLSPLAHRSYKGQACISPGGIGRTYRADQGEKVHL